MKNLFQALMSRRMLVVTLQGFSSGLPLLLIWSTLQAWLTDLGVSLAVIGTFALARSPYSFKFLWAPFFDRYQLPFLGRRRGWLLVTQILLAIAIAGMGMTNPAESTTMILIFTVLVGFLSASQDIVVDAYRREILPDNELGLGSSFYSNTYRIAMWVSSGLALILADQMTWEQVYIVMSFFMAVGVVSTFIAKEPEIQTHLKPKTLKEAVVEPLSEYFKRDGAIIILLFILLYKMGDQFAANMTMPFYLQIGFEKTEVGVTVKTFGVAATIIGAFIGGGLLFKWGINKSLWIFGVLQMLSTFGFALLAEIGPSLTALAGVVAFENISMGMGTSAFMAYMAKITDKRFTATQYALLTSLIGLPRDIISSGAGFAADYLGWFTFFTTCTLLAIPGMVLLKWVAPWNKET